MTIRRAVLPLVLIGAMLLGSSGAAPSATDVGYRDFSFSATSVLSPTGEKPQSKLWFNDGTWWGSLFNRTTEEHHIYRYDRATHAWSDTGTLIDERNTSKADTLWDGTHLYVASANQSSTSPARLYRYSYDTATQRYSIDPGFPVNITNAGMEAIVLDKDTTGKLWVTYTQGNQVYVNRSLGGNDQTWGTPFVLPVQGTTVSSDDISGVVAFDSQIGVMWSNQTDSAMYFATHRDGDADDVWQASRTAIQGPNNADDHINLKSIQADDVSGRVFAAVKTSLDDLSNPNPNAPLILLLVRGQDGSWTNHVFGRVGDHHTRPIVMIDREHRNLYMFATAPTSGGTIYYKQTALSNISFPEGMGTPFIQSTTDPTINNATSTKQNVNSATGLLVQASDDTSKYYVHNFMDLGNADAEAPTLSGIVPTDGATGVAVTSNAEVTFSEAMDSSTINGSTFTLVKQGASQPVAAQVTYDSANNKAALDPSTELDLGATYTATVKGGASGVKDAAGNPLAEDKTWSFTTAAAPPPADTTTSLTSSADTKLAENSPTTNYGGATTLGADGDEPGGSGRDAYSILRWDLSSVPAGSRVSSASVTLNVTNPSTQTYQIYALKRPWVELAATWQLYAAGSPWEVAGAKGSLDRGDQVGSVSPTATGKRTFALPASEVQGWIDNPSTNGGIIIANTTNADGFDISSREVATSGDRPQLSVTYTTSGATDTTPPETAIDSGPSGTVNSVDASFAFSSTEPDSTFQCAIDGGAYELCTSPKDYSGLADGEHTFSVKATDVAGNEDASPASRTWTVDTTPPPDTDPPETTIDSGPSGTLNSASASFGFSSSEPNSTFECSLDGAAYSVCTSPKDYTNLSNGSHTFEVRAKDEAGNVDATPASRTFSVEVSPPPPPADTTPPETTIDSGPSGTIKQNNATFTFSSSEANSTFECKLDSAPFSACSSPKKYTNLAIGSHTFLVRATDTAGNTDATPASRTWTVQR